MYSTIKECEYDLVTNPEYGHITYMQSSTYQEMENHVAEYMEWYAGDMIFLDSVSFLDGRTEEKKDLDSLMQTMDRCIQLYGATFLFTTHTSSDAAKDIKKGKDTGVRNGAGSSYITKMATLSLLITATQEQRAQNMVTVESKKTRYRGMDNGINRVNMCRIGASNCYYYDKSMQVSRAGEDSLSDEELFRDE